MATLTNTKIKDTYVGLLKTTDNQAIDASGVTLVEDGAGNASALSVGRSGNGVSISGNLAVDTNTLYVDAANNRVGIGTTSFVSDEKLRVIGSIALPNNTPILFTDTGGSNRNVLNLSTSNILQIGAAGAGITAHTFHTAGSERMRIDSSGRVGIGTSSPSFAGGSGLEIERAGIATLRLQDTSNVANAELQSGEYGLHIRVGANGSTGDLFNVSTSGTSRLLIDNSGRVGIGTSSPSHKVEILGGNAATLLLNNDGSQYTQLLFENNGSSNSGADFLLDHTNSLFKHRSLRGGQAITFETAVTSGTTIERMRIDSSGRVGIGSSSPVSKLTLEGAKNTNTLTLRSTNDDSSWVSGDKFGSIDFYSNDASGAGAGVKGSISYINDIGTSGATTAMVFNTAGTTSGTNNTERMRIDSSGYLRLAGAGIQFNGDTAAANALDDYEEGTFIPEFSDQSIGGNTATFDAISGKYTKIGNIVYINIQAININTTGMTAGNTLFLRSLPFTSLSGNTQTGSIITAQTVFSDFLTPFVDNNTTYGRVFQSISGSAGGALTVSAITSGFADFYISLTYQV